MKESNAWLITEVNRRDIRSGVEFWSDWCEQSLSMCRLIMLQNVWHSQLCIGMGVIAPIFNNQYLRQSIIV